MIRKLDVPLLHELFLAGLVHRDIGKRFDVSEVTVRHWVGALRRKEGAERWPRRTSPPAQPTSVPPPSRARPLRPGEPTLPPLASLQE